MQLSPHTDTVLDSLSAAAALGDERTREIAARLAAAAVPAVRLALVGAVSDAADEITSVLVDLPGSPTVAVRLDGSDAVIDVRLADTPAPSADRPRDDGDTSARVSLRLSESLKRDIDAAAERDGISVNTWLARAAESALNPNPFESLAAFGKTFGGGWHGRPGGWGGPGPGGPGRGGPGRGGVHGGQHVTGWING